MQILICIAIVVGPPACVFIGAGIYNFLLARWQREEARREFDRIREMPENLYPTKRIFFSQPN
jgi:hypothetical protein